MVRTLGILMLAALPYLLGFAIGFGVAILGLRRWMALAGASPTANIVPILRRVGLRYLSLGLLLTLTLANALSHYIHGGFSPALLQHTLWGLPFGVFFGARFVFRRGER